MDIGDLVGNALQVGGDVAGHEDAVALILDELQEQIQHLPPDNRVQAAGGLVHHQELGAVGQGGGQAHLHPHAPAEILHRLALLQVEPAAVAVKQGAVPGGVDARHDAVDLPGAEAAVEIAVLKDHPHLAADGGVPRVAAQEADGAPVGADDSKHSF